MTGWLDKFLIALFLAIGERLVSKGKVKLSVWISMREATIKAQKYDAVINNPNSSLEDRLKAEDELGS